MFNKIIVLIIVVFSFISIVNAKVANSFFDGGYSYTEKKFNNEQVEQSITLEREIKNPDTSDSITITTIACVISLGLLLKNYRKLKFLK